MSNKPNFRKAARTPATSTTPAPSPESTEKGIALYHVVYEHEGFDHAANALFEIVRMAQDQHPGQPRLLFLDIDGHRNEAGVFDADMYKLQKDFVGGVLGPYLTEITMPLRAVKNLNPQRNDLPEKLLIGRAEDDQDAPDAT